MTFTRIALAALLAASTLTAAGCSEGALVSRNRTAAENLASADAYREAARRCNGADLRLAAGTDGSTPSDYICSGR